jgi:chemotaxis protein CheZ
MEAMEKNDEIVGKLREGIVKDENLALLDKISANGAAVFEACSFQDITGQRITKVVKSVTYVEDRVNALIKVWGKEEIEKIEVKQAEESGDEALLQGPALEGEGITQAEIDKLFD